MIYLLTNCSEIFKYNLNVITMVVKKNSIYIFSNYLILDRMMPKLLQMSFDRQAFPNLKDEKQKYGFICINCSSNIENDFH